MKMVATRELGAVATLNYVYAPAVAAYFLGATVYSFIKLQNVPKNAVGAYKKRLALALIFIIILSYVGQASYFVYRILSDTDYAVPQHKGVGVLLSALLWTCIEVRLLGSRNPIWHPYIGSWVLGGVIESIRCALLAPHSLIRYEINRTSFAFSCFRVVCFVGLVLNGAALAWELSREDAPDEERQSLLGNQECDQENGSASSTLSYGAVETNESQGNGTVTGQTEDRDKDIKEAQQKRLEAEGGWIGYLKGFTIFLPHLLPLEDWKGRLCIFVVILGIIADRILNVVTPRQVGVITDHLVVGGPMPWREVLVWMTFRWLNGFAGLGVIKNIVRIHMSNSSYRKICDMSFRHVMDLSMEFHSNKDCGEVLKSVEQASALTRLLETFLDTAPIAFDLVISLWYVTHLFDIYLGIIIMSVGILYIYLNITFTSMTRTPRREYVDKARAESKTVYESISNWQTVSYFNRRSFERERYRSAVGEYISSQWKYIFISNWTYVVQSMVLTFGFGICCMLAVYQISSGRKPVGNLVTLIMYWGYMMSPLHTISNNYRHLTTTLIDAERVLQLLRTEPTVKDSEHAKDLVVNEGKVEFEKVEFGYDERKLVLRNINFVAKPGTTVAFCGATGAGKSSILKLLFRFYDVTGGSIKIDGQDIRDIKLASLREALGVVPQDPSLFNQTILENLRYARLDATDEEIYEACKAAAVHDKILSFPDGYASKVGERGVKLSGGELQRVAIARCILRQPKIVILDEATSAVDSSTEQQIQDAFEKLSAGRTTFVVAHRLSTIMDADLIVVIDQGEIIEHGTHDHLLSLNGKYFELWMKQTVRRSSKASSVRGGVINDLPAETYSQELAKAMGITIKNDDTKTNGGKYGTDGKDREDGHDGGSGDDSESSPPSPVPLITLTPAKTDDESGSISSK